MNDPYSHADNHTQSENPSKEASRCQGKEKYDRATANRVVRGTRVAGLSSFKCDCCGHWHIGTLRPAPSLKTRRPRNRGIEG
jgi:hypothetical protein